MQEKRLKKNRRSCLFYAVAILGGLFIISLIFMPPPGESVVESSETPRPKKTSPDTQIAIWETESAAHTPKPSKTTESSRTPRPEIPDLAGLLPADIYLLLEERDFECARPDVSGSVAAWSCKKSSGGAILRVDMYSARLKLNYIEAAAISTGDGQAIEYFALLAGLIDPESIAWIKSNIAGGSATFGGIAFTLSGAPGARVFEAGVMP